jgi:hypothetical protein
MPSETSTGNEWSGAVAQADLVQYQPGAVVSRTLVKKPTGTVTAFAFDAGEGLSEHTAPFDALVTKALWGQVFTFAVLLCGSSSGESMQAATDKWHETGAIMGVAS